MGIPGIKGFNTKEFMWHVILIDECVREASSPLRNYWRERSLWGAGGLAGLTLFYPTVTLGTSDAAAADLMTELQGRGVHMPETHLLQWGCCVLQKAMNTKYTRAAPASVSSIKSHGEIAKWHRLLAHPHWSELRKMLISLKLDVQVDCFEVTVTQFSTLSRSCPEAITCRTCLGLSRTQHEQWVKRGYNCRRQAGQSKANR
jgi:hypothetical protein